MKPRNRAMSKSNQPSKKPREGIWGTLTTITLGLTVLVTIYYIVAFFSHQYKIAVRNYIPFFFRIKNIGQTFAGDRLHANFFGR